MSKSEAMKITKRKRDDEGVHHPRNFDLPLLDRFPTPIWRSGVNAKCDYFNQTWLEFTGRRLDQELGDGWAEGVHPEDLADCLQRFLNAFHSRKPFSIEYRLRRYDGEYRWILDQGRAFYDLKGRFAGYIGSCFDVTERRQAEEASRRSHEQLRALSVRLQAVREEESKRIARAIHDELGQALTSLNLDLSWIQEKLQAEQHQPLRSQLQRRMKGAKALLDKTVQSVQRISSELRPAMLDDFGLTATLRWYAEEFEARSGIRCRWRPKPVTVGLSREKGTAFFRLFQEILTNVARHSDAHSVHLKLVRDHGELILEVADDGKGFDEMKLPTHKSLGLLGMQERVAIIGGHLQVRSAPGKGTKITISAPIAVPRGCRKLNARTSHGK